jgi:hypothetical protein
MGMTSCDGNSSEKKLAAANVATSEAVPLGGMYVPTGKRSSQNSSKKIAAGRASSHSPVMIAQKKPMANGRSTKPKLTLVRSSARMAKKKRSH